MRIHLAVVCCLLVLVAGCAGPSGDPSPTDTPTAAPPPETTAAPGTTSPKAPPKGTPTSGGDTVVVIDNRGETAYVVDVTLVTEPFDGARVTYPNGTTLAFPDVSHARVLRRKANLMRATDVTIEGAGETRLEAGAGERVEGTIEDTPRNPVLIYLLYERENPAGQSHWLGTYVCRSPGETFGPIEFTLTADGGQSFDPACFSYETPEAP